MVAGPYASLAQAMPNKKKLPGQMPGAYGAVPDGQMPDQQAMMQMQGGDPMGGAGGGMKPSAPLNTRSMQPAGTPAQQVQSQGNYGAAAGLQDNFTQGSMPSSGPAAPVSPYAQSGIYAAQRPQPAATGSAGNSSPAEPAYSLAGVTINPGGGATLPNGMQLNQSQFQSAVQTGNLGTVGAPLTPNQQQAMIPKPPGGQAQTQAVTTAAQQAAAAQSPGAAAGATAGPTTQASGSSSPSAQAKSVTTPTQGSAGSGATLDSIQPGQTQQQQLQNLLEAVAGNQAPYIQQVQDPGSSLNQLGQFGMGTLNAAQAMSASGGAPVDYGWEQNPLYNLLNDAKVKLEEANKANEDRYQEAKTGYQDRIATGLQRDQADRASLGQQYEQRAQQIQNDYSGQLSQLMNQLGTRDQDLRNQGAQNVQQQQDRYQGLADSLRAESRQNQADLQKQYADRESRVLGQGRNELSEALSSRERNLARAQSLGEEDRRRIQDQSKEEQARAISRMVGSGLGNSTVLGSMLSGVMDRTNRANQALSESIDQRLLANDAALTDRVLNAQRGLTGLTADVTGQGLQFAERGDDRAINLGQQIGREGAAALQQGQQFNQAQAERTSGDIANAQQRGGEFGAQLGSALTGEGLAADERLSGRVAQGQDNRSQDLLQFIERRDDTGPNLAALMAAAEGLGQYGRGRAGATTPYAASVGQQPMQFPQQQQQPQQPQAPADQGPNFVINQGGAGGVVGNPPNPVPGGGQQGGSGVFGGSGVQPEPPSMSDPNFIFNPSINVTGGTGVGGVSAPGDPGSVLFLPGGGTFQPGSYGGGLGAGNGMQGGIGGVGAGLGAGPGGGGGGGGVPPVMDGQQQAQNAFNQALQDMGVPVPGQQPAGGGAVIVPPANGLPPVIPPVAQPGLPGPGAAPNPPAPQPSLPPHLQQQADMQGAQGALPDNGDQAQQLQDLQAELQAAVLDNAPADQRIALQEQIFNLMVAMTGGRR